MIKRLPLLITCLTVFTAYSMEPQQNKPAKLLIETSDQKQIDVPKAVLLTSNTLKNMLGDELATISSETAIPVQHTDQEMNLMLPLMTHIATSNYTQLISDLQKHNFTQLNTIIVCSNYLDIPELLGLAQITYNKKIEDKIKNFKMPPCKRIDLKFPNETSIDSPEPSFTKKLMSQKTNEKVTITTYDTVAKVDRSVVELSKTLKEMLNNTGDGNIDLSFYRSDELALILPLMYDLADNNYSNLKILDTHNSDSLIQIINMVNYLAIEDLFKPVLDVFAKKLLTTIELEGQKNAQLEALAKMPTNIKLRLAESILTTANARDFYLANFIGHEHAIKLELTSSPIVQQLVQVSPDNSLLARCDNNVVHLIDTKTGAIVLTLMGHTDTINALCFSPDGSVLATGSNDTTCCLWDVKTGKCARSLQNHKKRVTSLCWESLSEFGFLFATGSDDGHVVWRPSKAWDNCRGYTGHTKEITCLRFAPKKSLLATASSDGTIHLNRLNSKLYTILNCTSIMPYADSICFSDDGFTLIASHFDQSVYAWDISDILLKYYLDYPTLQQALLLHLLYKAAKNKTKLILDGSLSSAYHILTLPCLQNLCDQHVQIKAERS